MVCLGTTFLVDFLRGDEQAKQVLDELEVASDVASIATPTLMELQASIALNRRGQSEAELVKKVKDSCVVLPLCEKAAIRAGNIEANLILAGETIPPVDIMIAAIALEHGEAVLTRNVKHFNRVSGLEVRTY